MISCIDNNGKMRIVPVEANLVFRPPVTDDQRLSLRCNGGLFLNTGNCNAVLDGCFSIRPGQSFQFGNNNDLNIFTLNTMVTFDTTGVGNPSKRLEVCTVEAKVEGYGFYIQQP